MKLLPLRVKLLPLRVKLLPLRVAAAAEGEAAAVEIDAALPRIVRQADACNGAAQDEAVKAKCAATAKECEGATSTQTETEKEPEEEGPPEPILDSAAVNYLPGRFNCRTSGKRSGLAWV